MNQTLLNYVDEAPEDASALIDDSEELTYGELRRQCRQIAGWIRARHGAGQYLALEAAPTAQFVVTLLGVMASGNTPVPVACNLPPADLEYICRKSQALTVLAPLAPSQYADLAPADYCDVSLPAMILFTSGTTGFPKGVIISHQNLMHSCRAISDYLDYHTHKSAAVVLPLHYSYALLSQVCCQLLVHGQVRLFPNLRNPLKVCRSIHELGLETFCGVPSTYYALAEFHRMRRLEMRSVKILCSAGAAMDRARFKEVKEIFPEALFFNNYGMTEAAPRIAFIREDDPRFHEQTCGKPMQGVEVRIVDPRTHEQLPDGQLGMLAVKGPNVTSGYLNDPEQTAQAFTQDGYLLSGDSGYLDGGYIFVNGRYDDIFNVAGEKVCPLEIERVLNETPAVESSAVIGVPDAQRGMVPVAFLKLNRQVTRRELQELLRGRLLDIKMPQRYLEVRGFPTTSNGKLRRKDLSPDDSFLVLREIT